MNPESAQIHFIVPGVAVGKGRARAGIVYRNGKPVTDKSGRPIISHHTPEKTVNFEALVKQCAAAAMTGLAPLAEAAEILVEVAVLVPQSWSNKRRAQALTGLVWPTTKPDADNVIKALFDAMNGICWVDDKQCARLRVEKMYAAVAETRVWISSLVGERMVGASEARASAHQESGQAPDLPF